MMGTVSESLRVYCCLLLACNLFVSLIGIWPDSLTPQSNISEDEGIEGVVQRTGYPKHLESFYYRTGSALIMISAFLLWRFLVKPERRNQMIFWLIGFMWTALNLIWIGKSSSGG